MSDGCQVGLQDLLVKVEFWVQLAEILVDGCDQDADGCLTVTNLEASIIGQHCEDQNCQEREDMSTYKGSVLNGCGKCFDVCFKASVTRNATSNSFEAGFDFDCSNDFYLVHPQLRPH